MSKVVRLKFSSYTPGDLVIPLGGTALSLYETWEDTQDDEDYLALIDWLLEDFEVTGHIIESVNIDDVINIDDMVAE